MGNRKLKISVITVCYNAVDTIEETMLSVLNQTYDNIEYIIIDGGSTDGTVDIIKKYADRLAYWVSEPDRGIYDAMNKGIDAAIGDYINFMNAGDTFNNSEALSEVSNLLIGDAEIIYGDTIFKAPSGEYLRKTLPIEEIIHRMPFGHQSTFVKNRLMKETPFDTSFVSSGDFKFFYDCYKSKKKFRYIPITIAKYENNCGMSIDNYRIVLKENAIITGDIDKPFWQIKYYITTSFRDLKKIIKRFIPQKIILRRQRKLIKDKYMS